MRFIGELIFLDATNHSRPEVTKLRAHGWAVTHCYSVETALASFHENITALVAKMGVKADHRDSGIELIKVVKARYPQALCVLYSNSARKSPSVTHRCRAAGADLVTSKLKSVFDALKGRGLSLKAPIGGHRRILFVDCDHSCRQEIRQLQAWGFDVVRRSSNAEALDLLPSTYLKVLVTKLGCRVKSAHSGQMLVKNARSKDPTVLCIVYSWTAAANHRMQQRCWKVGAHLVTNSMHEIAMCLNGVQPTDPQAQLPNGFCRDIEATEAELVAENCNEKSQGPDWNFMTGNITGPVPIYTSAELKALQGNTAYRKVRIVVISDTHCLHEALDMPEGDILVSCGDFADRCPDFSHITPFNEWLGKQPYKHKIVIAGNQEYAFNRLGRETIQRLHLPNCVYLEDSSCVVEGITFYGTPWNHSCNMAFSADKEKRHQYFGRIQPCDILLTHQPPQTILDMGSNGGFWGDPSLLRVVRRHLQPPPRVHLFGHVHEMYGYERHDQTTFINCAMKWDEMRKPVVFDFFVRKSA
eukprot:NODE_939_length_1751_cov_37.200123_g880_i0.p1 GENE.NODE_939_length_1751_cov_37.200123_g880_i0~~NODE_939_length_1751_cov_37.200123_g880_i0.p1  ORF type:complete len:553 (+),score=141.24 NODE_939_length_1751_cov_37.200123_g880_i0:80-1660(+)